VCASDVVGTTVNAQTRVPKSHLVPRRAVFLPAGSRCRLLLIIYIYNIVTIYCFIRRWNRSAGTWNTADAQCPTTDSQVTREVVNGDVGERPSSIIVTGGDAGERRVGCNIITIIEENGDDAPGVLQLLRWRRQRSLRRPRRR